MEKGLIDRWMPRSKTAEEAIVIVTHETLHEVLNDKLGLDNTTFTEALFDALAERGVCGLWFGKQVFDIINNFLKGDCY